MTLKLPNPDNTYPGGYIYTFQDKDNKIVIQISDTSFPYGEMEIIGKGYKTYPLLDIYNNNYCIFIDKEKGKNIVVDLNNRKILPNKEAQSIVYQYRLMAFDKYTKSISETLGLQGNNIEMFLNDFFVTLRKFAASAEILKKTSYVATFFPEDKSLIIFPSSYGYLIFNEKTHVSYSIVQRYLTVDGVDIVQQDKRTEGKDGDYLFEVGLKIVNPLTGNTYYAEIYDYADNIYEFNREMLHNSPSPTIIEKIIIIGKPSMEDIESALINFNENNNFKNYNVSNDVTLLIDDKQVIDLSKIDEPPMEYQEYIAEIINYVQENPNSILSTILRKSMGKEISR